MTDHIQQLATYKNDWTHTTTGSIYQRRLACKNRTLRAFTGLGIWRWGLHFNDNNELQISIMLI